MFAVLRARVRFSVILLLCRFFVVPVARLSCYRVHLWDPPDVVLSIAVVRPCNALQNACDHETFEARLLRSIARACVNSLKDEYLHWIRFSNIRSLSLSRFLKEASA